MWTIRSLLLLRMRFDGVESLHVGSLPLRTFCKMNPYVSKCLWHVYLATAKKTNNNVQVLMKMCGR